MAMHAAELYDDHQNCGIQAAAAYRGQILVAPPHQHVSPRQPQGTADTTSS